MRERLEPTQQTVQRTLVNGRAHIGKRFQKYRKVTILASFESPLARQEPSVSTLNKLRSLEAHGSGGMLRCGIRGPVGDAPWAAYLNSIPGPRSPDEWRGSKRSAGLGQFRRRLGWLLMRCWACLRRARRTCYLGCSACARAFACRLVQYYPLDPA